MENYIFIIIAVVLAIFSAANKKNKREAEQRRAESSPDGAEKNPVFEDDFFQQSTFSEEIPVMDPTASEEAIKKFTPRIRKGFERPGMERIFLRHQATENTPKEFEQQPSVKENLHHPLRHEFSLKKAVIYSEILNRKY